MIRAGNIVALAQVWFVLCGFAGQQPSRFSYDDAKACSWSELRFRSVPTGKRQLSVHIPLSLHGAADLFYCDCAFNAWRLPVPPDLKVYDSSSRETCATLRVDRVSFALSENPFVPDFRQTVWSRPYGGYPIVKGELDDISAHLNFSIPVYPAYVADDGRTGPNAHGGDNAAILPEFKFDKKTPPMFMLHGDMDDYSPMASVLLYTELHKRKIPAQLFVYANVSHGLGDTSNAKGWQNRIVDWMEGMGF